jgi:hypothetical protein
VFFTSRVFSTFLLLLLLQACNPQKPEASPPVSPPSAPDLSGLQKSLAAPHPYGVVLASKTAELDQPCVFLYENQWWMTYTCRTEEGTQTHLAASDDLLYWEPYGLILPRRAGLWDSSVAAGSPVFQDAALDGSFVLRQHEDRFWMAYTGAGNPEMKGSALAIATTTFPPRDWILSGVWDRQARPSLSPEDLKARDWEKNGLVHPFIFREPLLLQGDPILILYQALAPDGPGRWGLAGSSDLAKWFRKRAEPLLDGAPKAVPSSQLLRVRNHWVLLHGNGKHVSFSASPDLVQWNTWNGEPLAKPSGSWDRDGIQGACLVRHRGTIYLFYASDGEYGSVIALATSRPVE